MGWQDRDWAKFDEDELRRVYGVVRTPSPARTSVWGGLAVLVLVLVLGVFAYQQRETGASPVLTAGAPVLYGIRGTDTSVDPLLPNGTRTVCVEEGYATGRGWACISWALNEHDVPVVAPPPYQGACTHLLADTTRARWTCLGAYPYAPDELPPPAAPATRS